MFRQMFSTGGGALALVRLGLGQIKPNVFLPTYRCSRPLLSELYLCRQYHSVLSINYHLRYPSCRTVGQLVFCRRYMNDTRRQRSSVSYIVAIFIFMVGAAYAGVPLYRMICQVRIRYHRMFYILYIHPFGYSLFCVCFCTSATYNIVYNVYLGLYGRRRSTNAAVAVTVTIAQHHNSLPFLSVMLGVKFILFISIIFNTEFVFLRLDVVVSVVGRINEVNQHRARLVHDG